MPLLSRMAGPVPAAALPCTAYRCGPLLQDLPNYAQHTVPIFSLPTEWLWCETWCGNATKPQVNSQGSFAQGGGQAVCRRAVSQHEWPGWLAKTSAVTLSKGLAAWL